MRSLSQKGACPLIDEPTTHPRKPTRGSLETSPEAKALVEELQNVLRNEEAWYIAEEHLKRAKQSSIEEKYEVILAEVTDANTP